MSVETLPRGTTQREPWSTNPRRSRLASADLKFWVTASLSFLAGDCRRADVEQQEWAWEDDGGFHHFSRKTTSLHGEAPTLSTSQFSTPIPRVGNFHRETTLHESGSDIGC